MTPRNLILVILAASAAILGGALVFEYAVGLVPCELCLLERKPWYVALVAAVLLAALRRKDFDRLAVLPFGLLFLVSAGIAAYHVGVEQHLIPGPTACAAAPITGKTAAEITAQLLATPVVACDQVQWSLFGISLAGWNAAVSLAILVAVLWTWSRRKITP